MSVDYVRLVSIDDPTRVFVPEPVDPQWEIRERAGEDNINIPARRQFVGGIGGAADMGAAGGSGGVPWFAPSQWANYLWDPQWTDDVEQDDAFEQEDDSGSLADEEDEQ